MAGYKENIIGDNHRKEIRMKVTKNWVPQYVFSWSHEDEATINKMYYLLDATIEMLEKIETDGNSTLYLKSDNCYTINSLEYLKDKIDELHSINGVIIDNVPNEFRF